jgi:hypothetical protein
VLKTLSACLLGGLGSAFRLFWENTKEKMASIRTEDSAQQGGAQIAFEKRTTSAPIVTTHSKSPRG